MYKKFGKRILDVLFASLVLIISSPILFIVTLLLLIFNDGKVFFRQRRPGLHAKVFGIYKFKSMNDRKDGTGKLLPDAKRLTPLGKFIRSTSLDELPQFINVLLGDMSVIGPRPLLEKYLPLYNDFQKKRHDVKPGITGWAQVNGRNNLSWDDKFSLDIFYVNNLSLLLDLKIFWLTIKKVLFREGIVAEGTESALPFEGSKKD